MDNLSYWKNKWIEVGKDYILNKNSKNENIKLWDNSSKNYDIAVTTSRLNILTKLEEEGFINEDSIVLDLGCGTGAYTLPLSEICKEVHALDYSEGMLKVLKEKIEENNIDNIKILNKDWNEIDLIEENMFRKYDFVLCSLNPGCYNPESLLKINDASKDSCCFVGTDGRSKNKIFEKADKYILGEKIKTSDISNIIYPFNILYFSDYNPSLFYTTCKWTYENDYEKAANRLVSRYKNNNEDIDKLKSKIDEFIASNMIDEKFVDESENTLGIITWKLIK